MRFSRKAPAEPVQWRRLLILAAITCAFAANSSWAGDWPGWRRPTGAGHSDEKDLPLTWGGKKEENVLWRKKLDGNGYSSPIVSGERVFVTTAKRQTDAEVKSKAAPEHHVTCYEASTGKQLWQTQVPAGPERTDNYAVPTPCTDGKLVFAWFGSGVLAALDFDGKIVWHKDHPGPFSLNPALSSSPILNDDLVILLCDEYRDRGFLHAYDKSTGEIKWSAKRPGGSHNNATPVPIQVNGRTQLLVSGGRDVRGIDPKSGKTLWSSASSGFVPSPAVGSGLVYLDNGVEGPGMAIDPTGEGDVTKTHRKWQTKKTAWSYASPIIVGDYVYRAHKPGIVTCRKLATGEEVYSERLDGVTVLSSPFATTDGRIYFASAGKTYVLKAGPDFEVLATNELNGGDDGPTPAVANGRIYLKSSRELICVGRK